MLYLRVRPTWKKKFQLGIPPSFFIRIFEIFKPPQNPSKYAKKIWKNSHVYTCLLTILCENFKIFEPPPSKVWIWSYLGWDGSGRGVESKIFLRMFYIKTNILGEFQSNRWKCGLHHLMCRGSFMWCSSLCGHHNSCRQCLHPPEINILRVSLRY